MIDCLEHNSLQQVGGYRWWEMKVTPPGVIAAVLNCKYLMEKQSKREGNQILPFVRWQNNIPLKALSGNDLMKRAARPFVLVTGRSYHIGMSVCYGLYLDPLTRSLNVCHLFPSS